MQKYIIKIYVILPKIHTIMFKTFGNFDFFLKKITNSKITNMF